MSNKRLVLKFETEKGKKFSVALKDPKDGLKSEDIKPVMDKILGNQAVIIEGSPVAKALAAEIITTEKEIIDFSV